MVKPFPALPLKAEHKGQEDFNPAIRVFGRRFFGDQSVSELLIEFLLVATSPKSIDDETVQDECFLPSIRSLKSWTHASPLKYAPKARMNLKLFAFLGASKLDTRHETHREHFRKLIGDMVQPGKISISSEMTPDDVVKTLENLFLGFQSVGGQRTWCAQAFLPISRNVVSAETLWNDTQARREGVNNWQEVVERFTHFFSYDKHRFLARGGELLYLQLCNALRQETEKTQTWLSSAGFSCSHSEHDPEALHASLETSLPKIFQSTPETVDKLAAFLDSGVDPDTAKLTDYHNSQRRYSTCGWCPAESWQEGFVFAIELSRLCQAVIDPVERLELLEIACAMQVLRSLCAQSARYSTRPEGSSGPLGYVWVISDPVGQHTAVKQISRRNVSATQRLIYDAIRHPSIRDDLSKLDEKSFASVYREADRRYGHKLFITLAKRLGLIVPRRGAGARFVLNDRMLRYLVLSTIRPGNRVTFESFKKLLFAHHGLAIDDETIGRACLWSGTSQLTTLGGHADEWLIEMLDASGMLIRLSDACSLVVNPFGGGDDPA